MRLSSVFAIYRAADHYRLGRWFAQEHAVREALRLSVMFPTETFEVRTDLPAFCIGA